MRRKNDDNKAKQANDADGWTDGLMDGPMDGLMDGPKDGQTLIEMQGRI